MKCSEEEAHQAVQRYMEAGDFESAEPANQLTEKTGCSVLNYFGRIFLIDPDLTQQEYEKKRALERIANAMAWACEVATTQEVETYMRRLLDQ